MGNILSYVTLQIQSATFLREHKDEWSEPFRRRTTLHVDESFKRMGHRVLEGKIVSEDIHAAFSGRMHTAYKHKILRKYLPAWMQILRSTNPQIAYVDCYAGPGLYPDGTKGSPLIALEIAGAISDKYGCTVWCIFNDNDSATAGLLRDCIETRSECKQVLVVPSVADANDLIDHILNDGRFAKNGMLQMPMFFFIDPFGLSVSMEMLKKIMDQPKTEILLTFMIKDLVRWGKTPAYMQIMTALFGHSNPLALIEQASGRNYEQKAVNAFVERLRSHARVKHVIKYRIFSQEERRTLFYLVHGSNHFKGFKLMKGIMYGIGVPGAFAYLGPDHPQEGQTLLPGVENSEIEHLQRFLLQKYSGKRESFSQILLETYAEGPYIEKHFRAAVCALEREGRVRVYGVRRRPGTLKENHVVEFL